MKRISAAGKYHVQIAETRWEKIEGKNGGAAYPCLVLKGVTSSEEFIEGRIFFNGELCTGGKFVGKPRRAESMAKCIELGMSKPFNPANTGPNPYNSGADQLYGATCEFVVEIDEKYGAQVKYINTTAREPMKQDEVRAMFAQFGDIQTDAPDLDAPSEQNSKTDEKPDDLPFS